MNTTVASGNRVETFTSTLYDKEVTIEPGTDIGRLQGAINGLLAAHERIQKIPPEDRRVELKDGRQDVLSRLNDDARYKERTHHFLGAALDIIEQHYPKAKEVLAGVRQANGSMDGTLITVSDDLTAALEGVVANQQLRDLTRAEQSGKMRYFGCGAT